MKSWSKKEAQSRPAATKSKVSRRFDTLAAYTGPADDRGVRDLLESVAQKNYPQTEGSYEKTMWSIVYCPEGRCADFYFAENYEHSYGLLLQEKGGFLKHEED